MRWRSPTAGASGGRSIIAWTSVASRSTGRPPIDRTVRALARGSQSASWVLKSAGEANRRPGRNEVSRNPLARSTMPLYSGSRGGASTIRVARVPANAAAATLTFPLPPIADSRSHSSVLVTRPTWEISCHIPARMSPACRDGIIVAVMNRERQRHDQDRQQPLLPGPTGIRGSGNHRSHWVNCPGS